MTTDTLQISVSAKRRGSVLKKNSIVLKMTLKFWIIIILLTNQLNIIFPTACTAKN